MFISVIIQIKFNPQFYLFRTKLKRLQNQDKCKIQRMVSYHKMKCSGQI